MLLLILMKEQPLHVKVTSLAMSMHAFPVISIVLLLVASPIVTEVIVSVPAVAVIKDEVIEA